MDYLSKGGHDVVNVVVCEEDPFIIISIDKMLSELALCETCLKAFRNAFSMSDYLSEVAFGNADILLYDIDGKTTNGIATAAEIKRKYPHMQIILLSSFLERAQEIFDAEPCSFLLKPVSKNYLYRAMRIALTRLEADTQSSIALTTRKGIAHIRLSSIKYIDYKQRWLVVHLVNEDHEIKMKMKDLCAMLPPAFLWCHQSYVVNMDRVRTFVKDSFTLFSGETIPISRPKAAEARERFLNYNQGRKPAFIHDPPTDPDSKP